MKQHALSACYPVMAAEAFEKLTADIKAHGLRHKIVLHKGQVLDGWHRYQACIKAGVTPQTSDYNGDNLVAWVRSANKHRRHMTASQDAMTEVSISEWAKPGNQPKGDSESPHATVAEMAENAGTDERTIQRAKRVAESGTSELKEAVRDGAISVSKAAKVARLPKPKQAASMKEKPAKKPAPDPDEGGDTIKELEAAHKEIQFLTELVESLKVDDKTAKIIKMAEQYAKLEGRVRQLMTTEAVARKDATYAMGVLAKIRKLLKVETNAQILDALKK